jgi:hypothetical protein
VKQKERELREIVAKLNEKNSNNTKKEEMIQNLKITIKKMNNEKIGGEKEKDDLREKNKYWKSRSEAFEQDKHFLQDQVLESKRQNKLLKLAISRLQEEIKLKDLTLKENILVP